MRGKIILKKIKGYEKNHSSKKCSKWVSERKNTEPSECNRIQISKFQFCIDDFDSSLLLLLILYTQDIHRDLFKNLKLKYLQLCARET